MGLRLSCRLVLLVAGGLLLTVGFSGCSILESPYSAHDPTYRQGEKGSFNIGQVTDQDTGRCSAAEQQQGRCRVLGKLILTNPSDNVSFQLMRSDGQAVLCASPAEAEKTLSTTGSLNGAFNVRSVAASAPVSMGGASSAAENAMVLQSLDGATHYIAVSIFSVCLAYASGIIEKQDAKALYEKIIDNAVVISGAAAMKQAASAAG
jgi:hypothetical protein